MFNKINISQDRQKLIVYLFLTFITFAVFWQVNQYDFVNFDDNLYVTENSHIQSGITLEGFRWAFTEIHANNFWYPITCLSFMLDYQLYGLNAGGYHLTNLIFHIVTALLLFWLFNRMTGAMWKSAFIAALFALHPLHVESVAWVTERKDVLSTFFCMLTLCFYVYYTEKPVIKRYLPVIFSFALALMSKPMVVTLPAVMILLDYWPLDRLQLRKKETNPKNIITVSTKSGIQKPKAKKEIKNTKFNRVASEDNIPFNNKMQSSEAKIGGIIPIWQLLEKAPFFILSSVLIIITMLARNPAEINFSLVSRIANAPVSFITYLGKNILAI